MAGLIASLFTQLGLDAPRQAALFRIRATLALRQFTRQRGRIVGLLLTALFFAPLAIGA
jgi:hypothetical protein